MAIGYFIHEGDRTTCGGVVLEGERHFTLNGVPRSREGDRVTCGKSAQIYAIEGGVRGFTLNGRISAGSLDSVSSCPCRAQLIPAHHSFKYEKQTSSPLVATGVAPHASTDPDNGFSLPARASGQPTTPTGTVCACDERFRLLNHRRLPLASLGYALLQNDQCIAFGTLDSQGHSSPHGSASPASLNLAINAPSPVME